QAHPFTHHRLLCYSLTHTRKLQVLGFPQPFNNIVMLVSNQLASCQAWLGCESVLMVAPAIPKVMNSKTKKKNSATELPTPPASTPAMGLSSSKSASNTAPNSASNSAPPILGPCSAQYTEDDLHVFDMDLAIAEEGYISHYWENLLQSKRQYKEIFGRVENGKDAFHDEDQDISSLPPENTGSSTSEVENRKDMLYDDISDVEDHAKQTKQLKRCKCATNPYNKTAMTSKQRSIIMRVIENPSRLINKSKMVTAIEQAGARGNNIFHI
ncbi:hypothetical protein EX30DRAFT_383017, partial [Ascodesmis nigricans]